MNNDLDQKILRAWQSVTSRPMTSREVAFAKLLTVDADLEIDDMIADREKLIADFDGWLRADGPDGWIDEIREDAQRYRKLVATGKFCALSTGGWGLSFGYGPRDSKDQLDAAADALPAQK